MARFLLDSLDDGNVREYLVTDSQGAMQGVETWYSDKVTEDVLDENQKIRNERGSDMSEALHHVARIPQPLWDRWVKETKGEIMRDRQLLVRYLRDRDYLKVRTSDKM